MCIRGGNFEQMTREYDTLRNNASTVKTCSSYQQFSGEEETKGNCGKTTYTGRMDKRVTVEKQHIQEGWIKVSLYKDML